MDPLNEIPEVTITENPFYIPVDIDTVIIEVATNFLIIFVVLLSVYPFLYLFQRLISYCQNAFDTEGIRKLEGGGMWGRLPDASLYTGIEKIANVRLGEKFRRVKK